MRAMYGAAWCPSAVTFAHRMPTDLLIPVEVAHQNEMMSPVVTE
jgi:hypothetical protein